MRKGIELVVEWMGLSEGYDRKNKSGVF